MKDKLTGFVFHCVDFYRYALGVCQQLLDDPSHFNETEVGVKPGDLFALFVEHYYMAGAIDQCNQYVVCISHSLSPSLSLFSLSFLHSSEVRRPGGTR